MDKYIREFQKPYRTKLKVCITLYSSKVNKMLNPPADRISGKHRPLNDDKYQPHLGIIAQPQVGTNLADKVLPRKKVKDEYIPTLMKQMGIEYSTSNLSLGCRDVNDLRKVVRGNGTFFNRQLVNANPIAPLSRSAFSDDRLGVSADLKQKPHFVMTYR